MRQAGEVTYADTHKGRKNEGVIEFRQYSDMKRALEKLDGTEVNGRKIRLIEDRPGAKRRRSYSRSRSRSRSERSSRLVHVTSLINCHFCLVSGAETTTRPFDFLCTLPGW